jgi:hypothetical protein
MTEKEIKELSEKIVRKHKRSALFVLFSIIMLNVSICLLVALKILMLNSKAIIEVACISLVLCAISVFCAWYAYKLSMKNIDEKETDLAYVFYKAIENKKIVETKILTLSGAKDCVVYIKIEDNKREVTKKCIGIFQLKCRSDLVDSWISIKDGIVYIPADRMIYGVESKESRFVWESLPCS